jgi:hypothetical protein
LLASPGHAQSAPDGPFESTNPITLSGTVVGVSSWTGTRGPEIFLIFDVSRDPGRREEWAASLSAMIQVRRGEALIVTGFPATKDASPATLLPYSAVPMLSPIAKARRVLRATGIKTVDDGGSQDPPLR